MLNESKEDIRGTVEEKAFPSVKMRDCKKESVAEKPLSQVDPQGGSLRAFEVETRLVDASAIQAGP